MSCECCGGRWQNGHPVTWSFFPFQTNPNPPWITGHCLVWRQSYKRTNSKDGNQDTGKLEMSSQVERQWRLCSSQKRGAYSLLIKFRDGQFKDTKIGAKAPDCSPILKFRYPSVEAKEQTMIEVLLFANVFKPSSAIKLKFKSLSSWDNGGNIVLIGKAAIFNESFVSAFREWHWRDFFFNPKMLKQRVNIICQMNIKGTSSDNPWNQTSWVFWNNLEETLGLWVIYFFQQAFKHLVYTRHCCMSGNWHVVRSKTTA